VGAVPVLLVGDLSAEHLGMSTSVAAGMMAGCSAILAVEAWLTSWLFALAGIAAGIVLVHGIHVFLEGREDLTFAELGRGDAVGALTLFLTMMLHSFGEGLSIGVSANAPMPLSSHGWSTNAIILASLAVHNVPEGTAICMAYRSKGISAKSSAWYALLSSLPQPATALASFCCIGYLPVSHELMRDVAIPTAMGAACGAMVYVVVTELVPEAMDKVSSKCVGSLMLWSSLAIFLLEAYHIFGWTLTSSLGIASKSQPMQEL